MSPTPFIRSASTIGTGDVLYEASCALQAVSSLVFLARELEELSDEDQNGLRVILDAIARTMADAGERCCDEYHQGYQAAPRVVEDGALPSAEPAGAVGAGSPPVDRKAGDDGATYPKVGSCMPSDDAKTETPTARRRGGRARRSA